MAKSFSRHVTLNHPEKAQSKTKILRRQKLEQERFWKKTPTNDTSL